MTEPGMTITCQEVADMTCRISIACSHPDTPRIGDS